MELTRYRVFHRFEGKESRFDPSWDYFDLPAYSAKDAVKEAKEAYKRYRDNDDGFLELPEVKFVRFTVYERKNGSCVYIPV